MSFPLTVLPDITQNFRSLNYQLITDKNILNAESFKLKILLVIHRITFKIIEYQFKNYILNF